MDFQKFIENLELNLNGLAALEVSKPINYGHQLQYRRGAEKVTLCVYNGKKGLRLVWQGNNALRQELELFVAAMDSAGKAAVKHATMVPGAKPLAKSEPISLKQDSEGNTVVEFAPNIWAGSDESGKGDFFGPLVVSAVALNGEVGYRLQVAGVRDCKLLTDKKILELEPVIKQYALAFSVLQLKPAFYNRRYREIVAQGGKLNQLLTSGHINALSKAIEELEAKDLTCDYALIDQFTQSTSILNALHQRFPKVSFSQRPKAESNTAVAAASILARAQFLRTMEELATMAGVKELPKGGGALATECAKEIAAKLGKEALINFVKIHFVNYERV